MVGEAVQRLMEVCLEVGSVIAVLKSRVKRTAVQSRADELRLKGALAMLRGFIRAVDGERWFVTVKDKETRIDQAIYLPAYEAVVSWLPKIQDKELIWEAERVLQKANECVVKVVGGPEE